MTEVWDSLIDNAVAFRRCLHRQPELTWKEHETARKIRKKLDAIGIPWRVCAETGTVAVLAQPAPGRHIAVRADIDALPITESTGAEWASEVAGCMHACGHDGHTAALYGLGVWLKRHEDSLSGPVSLFFQPAEEGGHGAKRMLEDGALEGVDAIFGWHNWPAIPFGKAVCPDGPVMAGNGTFEITVVGQGGHASQPETCRDPVLAAAAITMAMQQIVSRRLPPQEPAVLSVTSIDGRSFDTVIPGTVRMGGSIRFAEPSLKARLETLIVETARDTAKAYGVEAEVKTFPRYDATVNHAGEAARYRDALAQELGGDWEDPTTRIPIMASEDFSYYLKEVPGAFALLGANDGPAHAAPCHNANYDFNDALIAPVIRIFSRLAGVTTINA